MRVSEKFTLEQGLLLTPTPAGAYYAAQSPEKDAVSLYLLQLLAQEQTPVFDDAQLALLDDDPERALNRLYHLTSMGYIQAVDVPVENNKKPLQDVLPGLLSSLSDNAKAVLADEQGLYLAQAGFAHESAEELSALSANLHAVQARHRKLLHNNMGVSSSAWGLIDAAGNSQLGFWPLYLPADKFTLILAGMPRFNHPNFVSMLACLAMRYHN